jgi:hypothetical protein
MVSWCNWLKASNAFCGVWGIIGNASFVLSKGGPFLQRTELRLA